MTKRYTQEIPIAWHNIRDARRLVQKALAEHDERLRDAAGVAISELLENAMKYGESVPGMQGASFTLTLSERELCIEVSNGVGAEDTIARLRATIDMMAGAPDKEALYIERLQEILQNPTDGGRLGLLRIGYEGGFDLSYHYDPPIVTLTARRSLG